MKKIKKYIKENQLNSIILAFSLVVLVFGTLAIGLIKSLIIVLIIDSIVIIPSLLKKKKKDNSKNTKLSKKKRKKLIKIILISILAFVILSFIGIFLFILIIIKESPAFNPDNLYRQESSYIYDDNNNIQSTIGEEKREKLTYDELPEVLINAIVATEDANFFKHNGFDLKRFIVASFKQALRRRGGGASTLTMQVSKKNYTTDEASGIDGIKRKFTDIYMAIFKIEKKYTKEQIMEFYVNSEYMGNYSYGVEQASRSYFGKSAKNLTLSEAAMIAGLYQAPGAYDPTRYPDKAEARRKQVLYLMERHGYITSQERKIANLETVDKLLVKSASEGNHEKYAAFIDTVRKEVYELTKKDPTKVSMEIYTTLVPEKQEHLDKLMNGETFNWENEAVDAGVVVVDVKTGKIAAVGAGRNKGTDLGFNTATQTNKQIGSTAKPLYDYAPGIEYLNWSTYTPFGDEPFGYSSGQQINNWDNKFNGLLTLRTSLKESRNIPALKAFLQNDNVKVKNFVTSLGLHPQIENNRLFEAHSLGAYTGESPQSMAGAYAAFANGGYYIKPHTITKIVFRDTGEVFEPKITKTKVMSEETAYMISNVLIDAGKWGLSPYANVNGAVYGAKTGTTNYDDAVFKSKKYPANAVNDLWVNGISPDYAISIWYGYKELHDKYSNTLGNTQPRLLFKKVAEAFFNNKSNWSMPSGVVPVEIEKDTVPAMLPSESTPANMRITELFKKGTEPTEVSPRFKKLDNVTKLIAKEDGSKVNLSWEKVNNFYADEALLKKQLSTTFLNETYLNNAVNNIISNSNFGKIKYNIYLKDTSGKVTSIGSTLDNKFSYTPTNNGKVTFIVKTTYENSTNNISEGTEVTLTLSNVTDLFTVDLKGAKVLDYKINDIIKVSDYDNTSVIASLNGIQIVNDPKLSIKVSIKNLSNQTGIIPNDVEGSYEITYLVKYNNYEHTENRTVHVKK